MQKGGEEEARYSKEDDKDEHSMFRHEEHCSRKFSQ